MAEKSEAKLPEIILLDDDDDDAPVPAKEPISADEPSKLTESSEKTEEKVEETVETKNDSPVDPPAENKGALENASTSAAPVPVPVEEKADEVMEVDDDSDLELIAEVPVKKDAPTEKRKDAPTESKQDTPALKKMMTSEPDNKKEEPIKTEVDLAKQLNSPDATIPFTIVAKNKEEVFTAINLTTDEKPAAGVAMPKDEVVVLDESPIKDEKPDYDRILKESMESIEVEMFEKKVEKVKRKVCCNMDCSMTSKNYTVSDLLTKNFFEVKDPDKICYVCDACSRSVGLYRQKCLDMLELEQPIVNAIQYLPSKDMVILDDSDEEKDFEDDIDDKETFGVDIDLLNDLVTDFTSKYKISTQDEKNFEELRKHTADLQDEFKFIDNAILDCYKVLDEVQKEIFTPWKPQLTCVGSVDTEMGGSQYAPIFTNQRKRAVAMKKVTPVPHHKFSETMSLLPEVIAEVPTYSTDPNFMTRKTNIPPKGPPRNTQVSAGDMVHAMKSGLYHEWIPARVIEILSKNNELLYKVKFAKSNAPSKTLTGKHIAYDEPSMYQFEVRSRVIAIFHNPEELGQKKYLYYAGIIAEGMKVTNNYRYLIFFDDGCTQYVPHHNVRLVVKRGAQIWEDCHQDIREFIRSYLDLYPENPMVRLAVGQKVKTEWNTRWWLTRVKEVDCSLVLVHFEADNRTEWIYRGSQRLAPLYCEMQKKQMQKNSKSGVRLHRGLASNAGRGNHPEIEYRRMGDDEDELSITFIDAMGQRQKVSRSVAKKSTVNRPFSNVPSLPDRKETYGETIIQPMGSGKWTKPFSFHQCNPKCISENENSYKEGDKVNCNPMLIPIQQGWGRETTTFRNTKMQVFYRGPCGRRLRSMTELVLYLRIVKSSMPADLFSFDYALKVDSTFVVDTPLYSIKDISYGSENVKIPCVNTINHTEYPTYVNYSTLRTPSAKTMMNQEQGFLICCDCIDDCQDKTKCACHQLTAEEARVLDPKQDPAKVGYNFRRLAFGGQQTTAIYECNKFCKCNSTCLNRVVQQKMKFQLQLFKTEKRGWGLRTLHDIPEGSFLCIYAGQIMTEQEGNEEGKQFGDEYLAELDYIEVLERCKEGYESDVSDIEDADFDGSKLNEEESDDSVDESTTVAEDKDFLASASNLTLTDDEKKMTLRKRDKEKAEADKNNGDEEVEMDTGMHKGEVSAPKGFKVDKSVSIRYHFEHNDDIFVMDAKSIGNLGRYFNHSCEPNVIVQNVFVDTHDLRFPWVAFFTKKYVPAGTELCWDYNYEIGSLPDRRLDCYCESDSCRGRLL